MTKSRAADPERHPLSRLPARTHSIAYQLLDRALNLLIAFGLLLLTSPLFLLIPLLIKLDDPSGPILYRGERLGRHKKPFTILKFRSLKTTAASTLGNDLVTAGHNAATRIGRFLRDTRLDELPQLLNVLAGSMSLVGPRPERRAVYEALCKDIPGYDLRFQVRPGVIGYSQVFTPHGTYKRLRSMIDYQFAVKHHSIRRDLRLLLVALWMLALGVFKRLVGYSARPASRDLLVRIHGCDYRVIDCNDYVIKFRSSQHSVCEQFEEIDVSLRAGRKTIHFEGVCLQSMLDYYLDERDGSKRQMRETVVLVERLTPLNEYKFHKYVLRTSVG